MTAGGGTRSENRILSPPHPHAGNLAAWSYPSDTTITVAMLSDQDKSHLQLQSPASPTALHIASCAHVCRDGFDNCLCLYAGCSAGVLVFDLLAEWGEVQAKNPPAAPLLVKLEDRAAICARMPAVSKLATSSDGEWLCAALSDAFYVVHLASATVRASLSLACSSITSCSCWAAVHTGRSWVTCMFSHFVLASVRMHACAGLWSIHGTHRGRHGCCILLR